MANIVIKRIAAGSVCKLVKRARRAGQLPRDWPNPCGWRVDAVDPMKLLACFKHLSLKPGFILHSLVYADSNSRGVVWAYPIDTKQELPSDLLDTEPPSIPETVIEDVCTVLKGDGSAASYFEASMFLREASEVGAYWHGLYWSTHHLLTSDPFDSDDVVNRAHSYDRPEGPMQLLEPLPMDWRPVVEQNGTNVKVVFYTYSGLGRAAIYRHCDSYNTDKYCFAEQREAIADGQGGYVF